MGPMEIAIIAGVVVLLFGTAKLPKLGGAIGESIRNFKKGVREEESPQIADKSKNREEESKN